MKRTAAAEVTRDLTKAETVALWRAVQWMQLCLRQEISQPDDGALMAELEVLATAKRALRKVNVLRKLQRDGALRPSTPEQP